MEFVTKILNKIFGDKSDKDIKSILPYVEATNKIYEELSHISNDDLRGRAQEIKRKINDYIAEDESKIEEIRTKIEEENPGYEAKEAYYEEIDKLEKQIDEQLEVVLDQLLPEAFAVIKETARRFKENTYIEVTANEFDRNLAATLSNIEISGDTARYYNKWIAGGNEVTWDMVHYDVQLIGGVVMHQGKIAEMATGEGKTLAATLPIFLNGLTGRGVHIVTVNDYLAKRDAEWMGPLFQFHGLSVDCVDRHRPSSEERRKAYQSDVIYGTNNEFGFDYLRDNMAISPEDLVQRKHHFSIVDEVDSVLIDDARTPLIISGPISKQDNNQLFDELKPKVEKLVNAQRHLFNDILADAKKKIKASETEDGGFKLLQAFKALPKNKALIKYLSEPGNKSLMHKTENFYMQENSKHMHKVTDELFFIIDEKVNTIELTEKGIDLISDTSEDREFFVLPDIGGEIAEIEKSEESAKKKLEKKDQLIQEYAVKSERIHTINQLLKAYTLFEKDDEYVVIDNKVKIVDEQTGRIMEGRRYSDGLHQAIEAKERVKVEAATQTHATITLQNYFRMYHKLAGMTGTAETEAGEFWNIYKLDVVVIPTNEPIVREDKQDLIYRTKREKYNSVTEEIVNLVEQGRPVLVGTTSVEISEIVSRTLKLRGIKHNVLNAKLHQREAEIVAEAGQSGQVTIATNMAGRGTDIKLSKEVVEAGGLAIVGTERHESRRVDRQLRGRAGRQGDPGSSQFFVSLEDDLMRLFGSDRISKMMDRLGLEEGEVIQHSMITRSIERAQKKVEENNFGIRKRLLEYDDVMNSQREVIYKKRKNALFGERLGIDVMNMMYDVCENITVDMHGNAEFEDFNLELLRTLSIASPINEDEFKQLSTDEIIEKVYGVAAESYERKKEAIIQQALPVITQVYEKQGQTYENIAIPISDGQRVINIPTNLERSYNTQGRQLQTDIEKTIMLLNIDEAWKEHLRELDDLRTSVQNATYEQKDPLLIYKFESFELFKAMVDKINRDVTGILMRAHIPVRDPNEVKQAKSRRTDYDSMETSHTGMQGISGQGQNGDRQDGKERRTQPVRVEKKVGRNEPCPCGSGKKYKNCHGKVGANV